MPVLLLRIPLMALRKKKKQKLDVKLNKCKLCLISRICRESVTNYATVNTNLRIIQDYVTLRKLLLKQDEEKEERSENECFLTSQLTRPRRKTIFD